MVFILIQQVGFHYRTHFFIFFPKIQIIILNIFIKSEHLQLTEPLMARYYDFHSTMLLDEISHCIESSRINYKKIIDGVPTIDFDESFRENKDLGFTVTAPYKETIHEYFKDYFTVLDDDSEKEEIITEDDLVLPSLITMSYVYHKEIKGLFQHSFPIDALDIKSVRTKNGYPSATLYLCFVLMTT